jgi:hypothetical protein
MATVAADCDHCCVVLQLLCRIVFRVLGNSRGTVIHANSQLVKLEILNCVMIEVEFCSGFVNPIKAYVQRYFRLIPVTALLVLYLTTSIVPDNKDLIKIRDGCRAHWIDTMALNLKFHKSSICLEHSWYLSCDFQLFLLSPFIVGILNRFRRKGIAFFVFIVVALQFYRFDILSKAYETK